MTSQTHEGLDDIVILAAVRTPIGSFNGRLSALKGHQLGAVAIKAALAKVSTTIKPDEISEVLMGQVLTADEGQNPARQAARGGGLPYTVPATTVNMVCGSGMKAVVLAAQAVRTGDSTIVIAGGQESMSQAPHCVPMRQGKKMGDVGLVDSMVHDGLTDAFNHVHMGITAETVAATCNVTREEQDEFAVHSQRKCEQAMSLRHFDAEIEPMVLSTGKSDIQITDDEYPRKQTTIEALSRLKTVFKEAGTVTAGNSSGINDGAAALIICLNRTAKLKQQAPLAKIVSWAQTGIDPLLMGLGPITAIKEALRKANWDIGTVDLFELNEAFAAQSVAVSRELGIDPTKLNVNGGAIALGHPLGASGARVLVTLIHTLKRTGLKRGCAALCIGGGLGIAMCIEAY